MLSLALLFTALSRPEGILFAMLVMTYVAATEFVRFAGEIRSGRIKLSDVPTEQIGGKVSRLTARLVNMARIDDDPVDKKERDTPAREATDTTAPVVDQIERMVIVLRPTIIQLVKIAWPFVVATLIYFIYMKLVNGSWYPNTYLVKADRRDGLIKPDNISSLINNYVVPLAPVVLVGLSAAFANAVLYFKHRNVHIAFLAIVTLAFFFSGTSSQAFFSFGVAADHGLDFWGMAVRRYVDIAIPLIVLQLGIAAIVVRRHIDVRLGWIPALLLIIGIGWSLTTYGLITREFAWNSDGITRVDVGLAKYIHDELPAGSTVLVGEAGATGYWGTRSHTILDAAGLNTKANIGHTLFYQIERDDPDYLILGIAGWEAGIVEGEEVLRINQHYPSVLGEAVLVLIKLE